MIKLFSIVKVKIIEVIPGIGDDLKKGEIHFAVKDYEDLTVFDYFILNFKDTLDIRCLEEVINNDSLTREDKIYKIKELCPNSYWEFNKSVIVEEVE